MLLTHTHQFLGTFGGPGNGEYRGELVRAIRVIKDYAKKLGLPLASVLLRLDSLYGDSAPLIDVLTADLGVIARSRDYRLLDLEAVQQVLAHPPDHVSTHPESGMTRALYDCASVPLHASRVISLRTLQLLRGPLPSIIMSTIQVSFR